MTAINTTVFADVGGLGRRVQPGLLVWMGVGAFVLVCFLLRGQLPWLVEYPASYVIPVIDWINVFMKWFVETFRWFFKAVSWLLGWPMAGLRGLLLWLPWPATIAAITIIAFAAAGWRLALFCVCALLYMVIVGYWEESMNTLALVGVAVPLSIMLGLTAGILGFKSRRARRVIEPVLDLMQTIPTFAYLIPILLLFGFGPVIGLIASAIYASPPLVRNVMLGLGRVPSDIVESARMSGTTDRQLLWWVQLPSALPTIMVGVNQTIMAALSMVIIAAVIGGFGDIGWEVLSTMRKAQFGNSLLAGIVIALIAMIMDRISRGFAGSERYRHRTTGNLWQRHRYIWMAFIVVAAVIALAQIVPGLHGYPKQWEFYPAGVLNDAVFFITANYPHVTDAIKSSTLFYFMLPVRVGLETAVRPFSWGFELTLPISLAYAGVIAALAIAASRMFSWRAGVAIALVGGMFYFGVTTTPWPAFILVVTVIAWQVGGWRIGMFALGGLLFMLLTGVWPQAMLSVYLTGTAVFICFVIGGLLGIWAARSDRFSAFVRPINDTLQSMPLFVFLIPVLMFFHVGEFTALLAIIAYAIVPVIRYTEHGIRHVPPETVEAATALGCTQRQLLFQVKIPLALPEIMLGLNQTVMFALAMLVITALVGTRGLGQLIYIALTSADTGKGVVAGLSMALIAMIIDRIMQSWSHRKKIELGLVEDTR